MNITSYIVEYRDKVYLKWEEIDPESEEDWRSLAYGWALAKGFSIEEARSFSRKVEYIEE